MTKNQLELKQSEIDGLSQYATKVIRESYNSETEVLVTFKQFLDGQINNSQESQTARTTRK